MRSIVIAALAAGLALAAPAAAHDFKHPHRHHGWYPRHPVHHSWHHPPAWGHWKKKHVVHHHYYYHPLLAPGVMRPGVHVVFPDIYLPWPR
jgi:hypothetical protein